MTRDRHAARLAVCPMAPLARASGKAAADGLVRSSCSARALRSAAAAFVRALRPVVIDEPDAPYKQPVGQRALPRARSFPRFGGMRRAACRSTSAAPRRRLNRGGNTRARTLPAVQTHAAAPIPAPRCCASCFTGNRAARDSDRRRRCRCRSRSGRAAVMRRGEQALASSSTGALFALASVQRPGK